LLVDKSTAIAFIDVEFHVNAVAYYQVLAMVAAVSTDVELRATHLQAWRATAKGVAERIAALRGPLAALPLARSAAFFTQWVGCSATLAEAMVPITVKICSNWLLKGASAIDKACPNWGSFITDSEVIDDLARLQILKNPSVHQVPAKIRTMATVVGKCKTVGSILELSMDQHPASKDAMRVAMNSFQFGKKTVNVAAATRVLFDSMDSSKPCQKKVKAVLAFKDSLPTGLVARLETFVVADAQPKAPATVKAEPQPPKRGGRPGKLVSPSAKRAKQDADCRPAA
jgi:hypothetical protein